MPYADHVKGKKHRAEYYLKNRDKILTRNRKWVESNKDRFNARKRQYRLENIEKIKLLSIKYRKVHKKELKIRHKVYYQKNKEQILEYRRLWGLRNKKGISENGKKYRKTMRIKLNRYFVLRKRSNPEYRIACRLRNLLLIYLKIYTKEGKVGSSSKYGIDFKAIIDSLKPFPNNLSEYHIDHIRPLCSFSLIKPDGSTDLEQVRIAFSPSNLQWLKVKENLSKGGRYSLEDFNNKLSLVFKESK